MNNIKPNEITKCIDTNLETASFNYYDGIEYTKQNNLKQTTKFSDVRKGTHFIVICGDVLVKVDNNDFKNIKRRKF